MDENLRRMIGKWNEEMAASPGIPLWPEGRTPGFKPESGQIEPSVVPFILQGGDRPRGAVIVCPGGAYEFKAWYEGRPIARRLNEAGIHAFVLDYRVTPHTIECPLADAQRAIRTVRARSGEWGVDPDRIGILGFSAGGHLAIMASTHFDHGDPESFDPVERVSCRPDAQVPCYPLVSFKPIIRRKDQRDWLLRLFGPGFAPGSIETVCGEMNVRKDTPPAFLWGTGEDFLIDQWPLYIRALKKKNVPYAYHLFPKGVHGLGLAENTPMACRWPELCVEWLEDLGF